MTYIMVHNLWTILYANTFWWLKLACDGENRGIWYAAFNIFDFWAIGSKFSENFDELDVLASFKLLF